MKFFSYIVARDYGFAPNPFGQVCTLAACKPVIRRVSKIGDWIFGTGSASNKAAGKLIYAMEVNEKLTFDEYWLDRRFQDKKPKMNGSFVNMYGDNIYHKENDGSWLQDDSHHAMPDGSINPKNLKTDTNGVNVLISFNYYYFGKNFIDIPIGIKDDVCMGTQGFKYVSKVSGETLLEHLKNNYKKGKRGNPIQLANSFERYKGK